LEKIFVDGPKSIVFEGAVYRMKIPLPRIRKNAFSGKRGSQIRNMMMRIYDYVLFLLARGRVPSGSESETISLTINFQNIVLAEHVFYLSIIVLYKLLNDRLACKVVFPRNSEMKIGRIHFVVNIYYIVNSILKP
jgi:hypothetical protein